MDAKKQKLTDDEITENVVETCSYWVPRKKRRCKMTANKGSTFCGAHAPASILDDNSGEDLSKERVLCPLDPKHTVFKTKLAKHLTICNARDQQSTLPYIVKNINSGENVEDSTDSEKFREIKLHEVPDGEFYAFIKLIENLYDKLIASTITEIHSAHESLKEELSRDDYGQNTLRQLSQSSSLLGILERDQQIANDTSYVEFGAGKGQLSYHLATDLDERHMTGSQVILVDRMSLRHKKDNKVANRDMVKRIRADIADLKLSALPELKKTRRTVALSKHLCGEATDLTLRCIQCNTGKIINFSKYFSSSLTFFHSRWVFTCRLRAHCVVLPSSVLVAVLRGTSVPSRMWNRTPTICHINQNGQLGGLWHRFKSRAASGYGAGGSKGATGSDHPTAKSGGA